MKKIVLIVLSLALITALSACGEKTDNTPSTSITPSVTEPSSSQQTSTSESVGQPVTVKMADGSEKTATLINGFYRFETDSSIQVLELACFRDKPSIGAAEVKLVFEGDAPNAIALLLPKHIAHGDYQTAWENADSIINIEDFNADGTYGTDGSWQMPSDFWNYELRVFDDRQAEAATELAFVPLAAETKVKVGELIQTDIASSLKVTGLTPDKTEYEIGKDGEIMGRLDTEGFSDEAWIGVIPSGVPHGDDERNDTYDEDYKYLSELENGSFTLALPQTAGNYDLRICDGTVEVAYMTIIVK